MNAIVWMLMSTTVTYHVSHPLHKIDGVSKEARGKGGCTKTLCEFLVAAPVKSFNSGNGNRDSHALEVIGGGAHPFTQVRCQTAAPISKASAFDCSVELNGQTVKAKPEISFKALDASKAELSGHLNLKLTDFGVILPSLFGVPVKDEFVIDFESVWSAK